MTYEDKYEKAERYVDEFSSAPEFYFHSDVMRVVRAIDSSRNPRLTYDEIEDIIHSADKRIIQRHGQHRKQYRAGAV